MSKYPKVTLVGAGPGDPELITIKGVKALQSADVVLYDALVHPELLTYAPDAQHIPVGKRAGKASVSQDTINHLMVEHALKNKHVVRLKGGDPFVFARGFEELEYAEKFGIEVEVVLGISSVMLPGYYGIPLTVRGTNQSFTAITATTSTGELSQEAKHAAQNLPSVVFFMGLRKLPQLVKLYQEAGRGALPVAVISNGSLDHGSVITSTVDEIVSIVEAHKPEAPALLVFGEGVALRKTWGNSITEEVWKAEIA